MAKTNRHDKRFKTVKRLQSTHKMVVEKEHLQMLIDVVMKALFNNADKHGMHLYNEILKPLKINLPAKENDKLWDVLVNSGLFSPLMGFGNAGKLELTSEGIKLMTQYGSYQDFLAAQQPHNNLLNNLLLSIDKEGEKNEQSTTKTNPPSRAEDDV